MEHFSGIFLKFVEVFKILNLVVSLAFYAPPFYIARNGCKLYIRAYLNKDGTQAQSYIWVKLEMNFNKGSYIVGKPFCIAAILQTVVVVV